MCWHGRIRWRPYAWVLLPLLFLPLVVSCSSEPNAPEAQIRALLKRGETAAEKKESRVLRELISDKYSDSQGQDKKAVDAILRYYFLRNDSIHLFMRVQAITFPEPSRAQAVVLVAMAAQPIADPQQLERLHADLHRFEFTLAREHKEWKVICAEWRRAEFSDFL